MPSNKYFQNFAGTVWVQPDGPNTTPQPLLCADMDGIDESLGDITNRWCRDGAGNFVSSSRTQGTPSEVTGDVVAWRSTTRNWLDKMKSEKCPFPVYVTRTSCGREDVFLNYEEGQLLPYAFVTSSASAQNVRRRGDDGEASELVEQTYSLSIQPPSVYYYKLDNSTTTNASSENEALRDITSCTVPLCEGNCAGTPERACMSLVAVADSAASPATANMHYSNDYAATWAVGTTDPFIGGIGIASIICVQIDNTTDRLIAAQGTTIAGAAMVIQYSDDSGATWNEVTVGATNGEFCSHSGALFALDPSHIWICTDQANIYFSSDAGVSWTDQAAPAPVGAEVLNYIRFIDFDRGWAVGGNVAATGLYLETTDGGAHWNLATTEPAATAGIWVSIINGNTLWVGTNGGLVWYSNNWGTSWTQRLMPVTPTATGDGQFISPYAGYIGGYRTVSAELFPIIYRTMNGGESWEYYQNATSFSTSAEHFGLNAIHVCHENKVVAVGEQLTGGNALVWTLKPDGETWD